MTRLIVALFGILCLSANLAQAGDAAFGLSWGDTPEQAVTKGLVIAERKPGRTGEVVNSRHLPMTPSDTDAAALVFHDKHGLQKIVWHSNTVSGDPTGSVGQQKFATLAAILEEKYGTARLAEQSIAKVQHLAADEFYECLHYEGCGLWRTVWDNAEGGCVALTLKSFGHKGEGWLQVSYEGPRWPEIVATVLQAQDKKAF